MSMSIEKASLTVSRSHLLSQLFTQEEATQLNEHTFKPAYALIPDPQVLARLRKKLPQFQVGKVKIGSYIETFLLSIEAANLEKKPLTIEQIIILLFCIDQEYGQMELKAAIQLCVPELKVPTQNISLSKQAVSPSDYQLLKKMITRIRELSDFAELIEKHISEHKPYPTFSFDTTASLRSILDRIHKKYEVLKEWWPVAERIERLMESTT